MVNTEKDKIGKQIEKNYLTKNKQNLISDKNKYNKNSK